MKGFDGLITRCALSTEREFAAGMCDRLVRAAEREAGIIGMAQTHAGSVDWDGGMVTPEVPAGTDFESPLWLTFYIRGTAGNPAGALARAAFHVPYEAAVEQAGGDAVPRAGQLVIWEDATIGNGPPKQLGPAVADAVAKKMSAVFEALGAADGN